jgi:hypothetical protein
MLKTIILPRQARDKQRKSWEQRGVFSLLQAGNFYRKANDYPKALRLLLQCGDAEVNSVRKQRRRLFMLLVYFEIETIILSRQARDKHRESTQEHELLFFSFLRTAGDRCRGRGALGDADQHAGAQQQPQTRLYHVWSR